MIPYKQLSLADIFTDCIANKVRFNKFDNDEYEFLSLLDETISLDEIVPASFGSHFHALTGRLRKHLLSPMLKALLLQLIFSIPATSLLIVFLKCSQELRDFCGFDTVPDASKFTRLKQGCLWFMPPHAAANPAIQQMYINGHFCYAFKFGIVTNGPGIVKHISFYNRTFLESHPEIIMEKNPIHRMRTKALLIPKH